MHQCLSGMQCSPNLSPKRATAELRPQAGQTPSHVQVLWFHCRHCSYQWHCFCFPCVVWTLPWLLSVSSESLLTSGVCDWAFTWGLRDVWGNQKPSHHWQECLTQHRLWSFLDHTKNLWYSKLFQGFCFPAEFSAVSPSCVLLHHSLPLALNCLKSMLPMNRTQQNICVSLVSALVWELLQTISVAFVSHQFGACVEADNSHNLKPCGWAAAAVS